MTTETNTTNDEKRIYLDFAAATPLNRSVYDAMEPYMLRICANAGALHADGEEAKKAIEEARGQVAACVGGAPSEIVFTSGGTEGNNLAILGLYERLIAEGRSPSSLHMMHLSIEHSSVRDAMEALAKKGVAITEIPVDKSGVVDPQTVANLVQDNTVLISIMLVNSEVGTIQPLREIAEHIKSRRGTTLMPYLHTDASQAPVFVSCNVESLGVDMMTIDAQKMYGPKGVGFLYIRFGVTIAPIMFGGTQERGLRPGTPVTPLIVGLASSLMLAEAKRKERNEQFVPLKNRLIDGVLAVYPKAVLNGDRERRISGNVNISFVGIEGEYMMYALSKRGIDASTRSACLGKQKGGSYVIRAIAGGDDEALSAIRFSFGDGITMKDIDYTISAISEIVSSVSHE